jgi:hypothetical protein
MSWNRNLHEVLLNHSAAQLISFAILTPCPFPNDHLAYTSAFQETFFLKLKFCIPAILPVWAG